MLNLNYAANTREYSDFYLTTGRGEAPAFAANSVLGNIGGSVRTMWDYDDEDEYVSENLLSTNVPGVLPVSKASQSRTDELGAGV